MELADEWEKWGFNWKPQDGHCASPQEIHGSHFSLLILHTLLCVCRADYEVLTAIMQHWFTLHRLQQHGTIEMAQSKRQAAARVKPLKPGWLVWVCGGQQSCCRVQLCPCSRDSSDGMTIGSVSGKAYTSGRQQGLLMSPLAHAALIADRSPLHRLLNCQPPLSHRMLPWAR